MTDRMGHSMYVGEDYSFRLAGTVTVERFTKVKRALPGDKAYGHIVKQMSGDIESNCKIEKL